MPLRDVNGANICWECGAKDLTTTAQQAERVLFGTAPDKSLYPAMTPLMRAILIADGIPVPDQKSEGEVN